MSNTSFGVEEYAAEYVERYNMKKRNLQTAEDQKRKESEVLAALVATTPPVNTHLTDGDAKEVAAVEPPTSKSADHNVKKVTSFGVQEYAADYVERYKNKKRNLQNAEYQKRKEAEVLAALVATTPPAKEVSAVERSTSKRLPAGNETQELDDHFV